MITRSLGPDDHTEIDLFGGGRAQKHLLLCSDGLHGYFSAEELFAYISTGRSDEETCRLLVQEACAGAAGQYNHYFDPLRLSEGVEFKWIDTPAPF